MASDSHSREAIETAFKQLPFDAQCIIRLKPNFVFINDTSYGMSSAYPINAKIGDIVSSIRNKYNCHVEIFDYRMEHAHPETYLLDHLCRSENTIYVRLRSPTHDYPLSAEPFQLEHHPLPLAHIPSSTLHMKTEDFTRVVSARLQARKLPAHALLLNERGETAPAHAGSVVNWLMQTNSPFMYLRPQTDVDAAAVKAAHSASQTALLFARPTPTSESSSSSASTSASASKPASASRSGWTPPRASTPPPAPEPAPAQAQAPAQSSSSSAQTVSITLQDGVVLSLDPSQYAMGQGEFRPEESAIQSLREFVGLHTPEEDKTSLLAGSEMRNWPNSWRSAHTELVRILRDLLGKTRSPDSMTREDVIGMAAIQSLRLTYGMDVRSMTGLIDTNTALTRRVRQLETQLNAQGGRLAFARSSAYNLWRTIRIKVVSLAMITFQLAQMEVVQNALYIVLWAFIINALGRGSWRISAGVFLLCAINFIVHLLKYEYRLDVSDLVVTHCFPAVYPTNAAAMVDKDRIHIAAELDLAGEGWDMNEFLDSAIRRPTILEFVCISILSVVPSVLNKWQGSVDEKRMKLRVAIKELVEAEKAKISGKVGNDEGHSTAINTGSAGITNVNNNNNNNNL